MDRLEHRDGVAVVGGADGAEAADEAGAQIRHDVAVQVRKEKHVELLGLHHEVHARRVDDLLIVGNVRMRGGDSPGTSNEQAVAHLHDVGLVDGGDALPPHALRVVEGKVRDARRRALGDDLQAFDDAGNDFVLETRVQIFGVLAHDDEIDVLESRADVRKVRDRPQVRVQIERLAQPDVDAGKPFADRRRDGALQRDFVAADRVDELARKRSAVLLERDHSGLVPLPA